MGIRKATGFVWKKRYANMVLLQVRARRQLRDGNVRLKRLVAGMPLDRYVLQEAIGKVIWRRPDAGISSDGYGIAST